MPLTSLNDLYDLLTRVPPDKRPNLAILNNNEFLFSYKHKLSISIFMAGHGPVDGLRLVRGDVMDFFAQIEFIVNQIFIAHLLNSENDVGKFEQLLDGVDFLLKVKLLNKWALIDSPIKERLISLKDVRNGFAHNWNIESVRYKSQPIGDQFETFKADAGVVFSALTALYNGGDIDLDRLSSEMAPHTQSGHR